MPPPAPRQRRSAQRLLFGLLRRIEREQPTGLVRVLDGGGQPLGQVMVARGRVCCVAPAQGQPPIGAILAGEDAIVDSALEEAVRYARAHKIRLCEALLERGRLELPRLRAGLLRQAADGLVAMAVAESAPGEAAIEVSAARDDYDHRLTFTALDVFLSVARRLDQAPRDAGQALFEEYADYCDAALLLRRADESEALPLPVDARGLEESSLAEIGRLARTALALCQPEPLLRAGVVPRAAVYSSPQAVWVVAAGETHIALIRTGPQFGAGQVLGVALRLSREAVAQRRRDEATVLLAAAR